METNIKLKEIKINSSIKKYELKTTLLGYASKGLPGKDGINGENGATFTPSVDNEGNLSWTNNGNLDNPETKNIKGPKGDTGEGVPSGGTTGQVLKKKSDTDYDTEWANESGGGSGGTSDYSDLSNKPKINNVELSGNKSLSDLGITNFSGDYEDLTNKPTIPTKTSNLINDSGFLTNSIVELHGTSDVPINLNTLEEGCYKIYGRYILGKYTISQDSDASTIFLVGGWGQYSQSTSKQIIQCTYEGYGIKYIIITKQSDASYYYQEYITQNELVSGTNIKTINNQSILGNGNLTVSGGDTLPIGAIVEYDGTTVPAGYEKVSDGSISSKSAILVALSENTSITSSTTWTDNKIIFNKVLRQVGDGFSLDTSTGIITASESVKAFKCTLCLEINNSPSFEVYPCIRSQTGISGYTENTKTAGKVRNETIDKCDTNKNIYGVFRTSATGDVTLKGARQYTYMLVEEL